MQVTPLGIGDKGRLLYSVAIYNRGSEPINFGVENVSVLAAGTPVRVFTYAELERMAKNDATTALVITALAGGVAAYSAAQSPTYHTTTTTPFGTYTTTATNYAAQAVAVAATSAATTAQMNNIGANLDNTLSTLGHNVLQTTTVDPDSSYGGQIIADRVQMPDSGTLPTTFIVEVSGERFSFDFDITEQR